MRPKKIVLLVDSDDRALSVRKFLLTTKGYDCLTAGTMDEAIEKFRRYAVEVAVIDMDRAAGSVESLVHSLRSICGETRIILTSDTIRPGEINHQADCFLGKNYNSPADLYERVRVMAARKRGPKSVRPSVSQEPAVYAS